MDGECCKNFQMRSYLRGLRIRDGEFNRTHEITGCWFSKPALQSYASSNASLGDR